MAAGRLSCPDSYLHASLLIRSMDWTEVNEKQKTLPTNVAPGPLQFSHGRFERLHRREIVNCFVPTEI